MWFWRYKVINFLNKIKDLGKKMLSVMLEK